MKWLKHMENAHEVVQAYGKCFNLHLRLLYTFLQPVNGFSTELQKSGKVFQKDENVKFISFI